MARSSYVYVAVSQGRMTPSAGFTVKRELRRWLDTQAVRFRVYRLADNRDVEPKDITNEVYEPGEKAC